MSEAYYTEEPYVEEVDIAAILEEYHRKQLLENLAGPAVSLVTHLVILALMLVFVVTQAAPAPPTIEVAIVEDKPVELEPFVEQELNEVEETIVEDVPPSEVEAPNKEALDKTLDSPVDVSDEVPQTRDRMDLSEISDVRLDHTSSLVMDGLYGGRTDAGRNRGVRDGGGGRPGQQSVIKALGWLAKVQHADGSWGRQSPAHTGMALLVFLAYGETPLSHQYGVTVQKAMRWLSNRVLQSKTGNLGQKAYGHGIATYALAESYGMTRIPFLRTAMERAVDVIIYGQQNGGGYNYNFSKGDRWDLSVSGWQFQALKAAYVAGAANDGLAEAIRKSIVFCRRTAYKDGKFGYSKPGTGGNMTGVGAVALQLLGEGRCRETKAALETIAAQRLPLYEAVVESPDKWDAVAGKSMYGWYYDTQAMYNARLKPDGSKDRAACKRWAAWRRNFERALVRHQQPEGYWQVKKGHGMGEDLPGRVLATCWATLQLEVYYRYLPTFDINKMERHVSHNEEDLNRAGIGAGNVIEIN